MSDWKIGAAKRRDARATKISDESKAGSNKKDSKKDTKKWCRGKVGVEHVLKCFKYSELKLTGSDFRGTCFSKWRILACVECGKELKCYIPRLKFSETGESLSENNPSVPSWVTE